MALGDGVDMKGEMGTVAVVAVVALKYDMHDGITTVIMSRLGTVMAVGVMVVGVMVTDDD